MANTIDGIVKCDISIESPAVSEESMSGLLILVGEKAEEDDGTVKYYTDLESVEKAGYGTDSVAYLAVQTAFAQQPSPDGIYLVAVKNEEEPTAAVQRALHTDGWYHILPAGVDHNKYNALAVFVETTEKLLGLTLDAGETTPILQSGLMRTHVWRLASNQKTAYDPYLHVAICAKTSGYDPGSETWAFKQLSLITPGEFDSNQINTMDEANENYYVCITKKNITQNGKVLGDEWIDTIRFRDWLKNKIQLGVYNVYLLNTKVPFLDSGISLIQNAVSYALKKGQEAGGISGDFYDEDGNKTPGFTIYAPLASSFTAAQKKSRKLTGLKWSAYLAGAIHVTELSGKLGY